MRTLVSLIVLSALAAGAWAGWDTWTGLRTPFKGYAGDERFVDIAPGTGPRRIGDILVGAGVVQDALMWRIALWQSGTATRLKAGEYRFSGPMTPAEVIAKLERGEVFLRPVTFPEGLTIRQMARVFERAGLGTAGVFLDAARDVTLVADIDPAATDLEGYLFPDTYALPRQAEPRDLMVQMVARFRRVFGEGLRQEARAAGFTIRQVVTLASLVEKETARADERPVVSAVYRNRLAARIGLQCDPTVIYALERAGRFTGNLTREDLTFDSPYNTYRYVGLPPGPIASPGLASLEAAVRPAGVDYLYFVSRNDGSHAFARTLAEHNRNVQEWQVRYFRENQSPTPGRGRRR
ncbi:MAG: endolytic transglycosylase MltG [Acidobacteriota bacterium]